MSVEYCSNCDKNIDTDNEDHKCFWSLSDVMNWCDSCSTSGKTHSIRSEDVKKFIKELKEKLGSNGDVNDVNGMIQDGIIDKLAGDKLI